MFLKGFRLLRWLPQVAGRSLQVVCALVLSSPVQGGILVLNIFLARSALRALRRARFASHVRVIKDLKSPGDLRYLLGVLPPWIHSPDWERGDVVQTLLNLLWPAINTTVCGLLKRELEERVQESSDFGHIAFSRLSFGKHPPVVAGIKAVPLHGEDLLALVLDVDVRWAGEPDVNLRLTNLAAVSLGLSHVQLSGVVRLVFSPITEDPPFLRRMTVSLLGRPYVDFSVRALGGDIMALPAIAPWLHSVVMKAADHVLVWPKEVGVPFVPPPEEPEELAIEGQVAQPLGVLVVRVGPAQIEPRRSTLLGRLKLVSPQMSLVLPPADEGFGGGGAVDQELESEAAAAIATRTVVQAAQTRAEEQTLTPAWGQEFAFVVTGRRQRLRLLLSHKRKLVGANQPLGVAEIEVDDVIADADAAAQAAVAAEAEQEARAATAAAQRLLPSSDAASRGEEEEEEDGAAKVGASRPQPVPKSPPRSPHLLLSPLEDGYTSAASSPGGSSSLVWATPTASLLLPEDFPVTASTSFSNSFVAIRDEVGDAAATPAIHPVQPSGLARERLADARRTLIPALRMDGDASSSCHHALPPSGTALLPPFANPPPFQQGGAEAAAGGGGGRRWGWVCEEGVWVQVPATDAVTLGGMLAEATEPRERFGTSLAASEEAQGWMSMLQAFVTGEQGEEEEEGGGVGEDPGATVGRVQLRMQWLPVAPRSLQRTASIAQPSPKPQRRRQRGRRSSVDEASGAGPREREEATQSQPPSPGAGAAAACHAQLMAQRGSSAGDGVPRPPPLSMHAGILAVRVAYTKTDYGQSSSNPVLALSTASNPSWSGPALAATPLVVQRRLVCLDCQAGGRPGLLHWGRVFHLPVWDATSTRACLELGNAASSLKLSSYGAQLYALDAQDAFEADVAVEASAWIPLKDVVLKGVVRGTWRLRESSLALRAAAGGAAAAAAAAADRLDVGRAALMLFWLPLA